MKHTMLAVLICSALITTAQTKFILNNSVAAQGNMELSATGEGTYLIKETSSYYQQQDNGKFTLYSSDHKRLAQLNYQLPFKLSAASSALTEPLLAKDRMTLLTAKFQCLSVNESRYIPFWDAVFFGDLTMQEYNIQTMKPMGAAKTIVMSKAKKYLIKSARSLDGNWFAMLGSTFYKYQSFNYRLFNKGNEILTKDFELPGVAGECVPFSSTVRMGDNGDLAFMYAENRRKDISSTHVAFISASKQKMFTKKVEVKGKLMSKDMVITLCKDGGLVLAVPYCRPGKLPSYSEGILVEKYSADFELQYHSEIPFSKETLDACATLDDGGGGKGIIYQQMPIKIHALENGDYVLVTEQQYDVFYGNTTATVHNNTLCIGLSNKLENQYQYIVRQYPQKGCSFICYRSSGSYVSGNNVYVFHSGVDDSVKNTPDEFDIFCTWWEHGKTKQQTVEIPRPDTDFNMSPRFREIGKDKLLTTVRGKGGSIYTTLQIENK